MDNQNKNQQPETTNEKITSDNQVPNTLTEQKKVLESKVFVMSKIGKEFEPAIMNYDGRNISLYNESNVLLRIPLSKITKFQKEIGMPLLYVWVDRQLYRVGFSDEFKDSDFRSSKKSKILNLIGFLSIYVIVQVTKFALLIPLAISIMWFYNLRRKSTTNQDGSDDISKWVRIFKENSVYQTGLFGGWLRKPWFIIFLILLFVGFIFGSVFLTILLADKGLL
jgi:hypothetical protein